MKLVKVRGVLNRHKRRDKWFLDEYSVNPYTGCSFSCIYCYTRGGTYGRPPHELSAKVNAPEVLDRQLRRARRGFVALGTSTEPYMKVEEELEITRRILNVLSFYRFPVHVLTKSKLVLRDADILMDIAERAELPPDLDVSGSLVTVSLSTLDEELASVLEPGAPSPLERLEVVSQLRSMGVEAGLAFIPVIPFLTDGELEDMMRAAKKVNSSYVFVGALTLPGNLKTSFMRFLRLRYPELVSRYRDIFRGGYPKREYQNNLYERAAELIDEYGLKFGPHDLRRDEW